MLDIAPFLIAFAALFAPRQTPAPALPAPATEERLSARIAVIGASCSSGFRLDVSLADALDAFTLAPHAPIVSKADEALFISPEELGSRQVDAALAAKPTLVVGLDFLFWFGYGEVTPESERMELLETGLELLEQFQCPLVLATFPDMSPAVGKMLLPTQMPKTETLAKLTARVEEWAKKRGRVVLVPLAKLTEDVRAGRALTVSGKTWPPEKSQGLLQDDQLHPTVTGLAMLARTAIDVLQAAELIAKPGEFEADFDAGLARLRETAAKRAHPITIEFHPPPKDDKSENDATSRFEARSERSLFTPARAGR